MRSTCPHHPAARQKARRNQNNESHSGKTPRQDRLADRHRYKIIYNEILEAARNGRIYLIPVLGAARVELPPPCAPGVSWQPTEMEDSAARRVHSVLEIRRFSTAEIGKLRNDSAFAAGLRPMRTACREFLDRVGAEGDECTVLHANHRGHWASWTFCGAFDEMRGIFGIRS